MSTSSAWEKRLESLDASERDTLLGTSLSRRFTKLPLWLSHPANIGGFYGMLVSIAIILPYKFAQSGSGWVSGWLFHSALLVAACLVLGLVSILLVGLFKRFPISPPRGILYPMPFIGFALLTIDRTDMMQIPSLISWFLLLLPGPMYVHLSWAPRWRLLCMIEDGKDPFAEMTKIEDEPKHAELMVGQDKEMLEVVDTFDQFEEE
ncbi:MAG: hypothetical protein GWO84_01095 [Euryarchaeota archaeon]|nr:hypothetical protein [Euryarchaeota archaeon]